MMKRMKIKQYKYRAYLDDEFDTYIDLDANEYKEKGEYTVNFNDKKIKCKCLYIIKKPAKYFIFYPINDFIKMEEEIYV